MTRKAHYSQAEVERAARALKAVGETILGVEQTPEGGFIVLTTNSQPQQPLSALEAWEREHGDRAA
jgi:hypothetical protein